MRCGRVVCVVFFFQAEDGIRDHCVTGVQTCALPIWHSLLFLVQCISLADLLNSGNPAGCNPIIPNCAHLLCPTYTYKDSKGCLQCACGKYYSTMLVISLFYTEKIFISTVFCPISEKFYQKSQIKSNVSKDRSVTLWAC